MSEHASAGPVRAIILVSALLAGTGLVGCGTPNVEPGDEPGPVIVEPVAAPEPGRAEAETVPEPPTRAVEPESATEPDGTPEAAQEPEPQSRHVALLLPLSGDNADSGNALLNAAQLAFFETGVDGLDLLVLDTGGTTAGAIGAAEEAVAAGAGLILGPLFGAAAEAVRPVVAGAGINVVSFSNNRSIAGEGIFVFGFLPDQQIRRVIAYAAGKGRSSFAVLAPQGPLGDLVVAASRDAARRSGVALVRVGRFDPNDEELVNVVQDFTDYGERRKRLTEQRAFLSGKTDAISRRAYLRLAERETLGNPPYDSLILPVGGTDLPRIASFLAYFDVDPTQVQLLGPELWKNIGNLGREPMLVGSWFAAPEFEAKPVFEQKFEQAYGARPHPLASLGYDAMLLAVALYSSEGGPDYSVGALTDIHGFAGVDGIFRLLPDGTNQRGIAVFEVAEDGVTVIDPAASTFETLGY